MGFGGRWLNSIVFAVDLSSTPSTQISGVVMSSSNPSAGQTKAGRCSGALWLASLAYLVSFSPVSNPISNKGGYGALETIYPNLWHPHTYAYLWIMWAPMYTYTCNTVYEQSPLCTHTFVHTHICSPAHTHACIPKGGLNDMGVGIRKKVRSGKGLVALGSKRGLASEPAYSFWPEFRSVYFKILPFLLCIESVLCEITGTVGGVGSLQIILR